MQEMKKSLFNSLIKFGFIVCFFSFTELISCRDKDVEALVETIPPPNDSGELPYLRITTARMIKNEPKVSGNLILFENHENVFSTQIGIEYRGSTSFRLSDKKSFGFEIWDEQKAGIDASILGFPEEEDWILTGHVFKASESIIFDPSLMHHYIGYTLYRSMGRYASRTKYVELEVNEDYLGAYLLMEKLKRDKNRLDIAKLSSVDNALPEVSGGYILKIDKTTGGDVATDQSLSYYEENWEDDARYSEEISFRSKYDINGNLVLGPAFDPPYHDNQYLETYFLYEYPKADQITSQQKEYIQKYIEEFETALLNDDFSSHDRLYTDYIDLNSFIDFFIINEITSNVDGYRLSTYLHKDRNQKLKMGPIWDLNIGYNRQERVPTTDWIVNYNKYVERDAWMVPFWWPRLLQDPIFQQQLKTRWQLLRSSKLSNSSVLNLVQNTADYLIENGTIDRNYKRWSGIDVDYPSVIDDLKIHLEQRLDWMDLQINAF
jgi:hypothetical protein